jgi:PTS system N-acetylglucosamine-specific IIC component
LLVDLTDRSKVDQSALKRGGILAASIPDSAARPLHLIAGDATAALAAALQPVR